MLQERDDIVALDSAILQHPRVWEASGHLAGFTDPMVDCRACKKRFRADHVDRDEMCPAKASLPKTRGPPPRPDRGARLQPHVQDVRRPGRGERVGRLPAPGDRAGHLHQLQERPAVQPQEAAVRHRPGRQVVSQRDHARQLHLPHARVRADGDGVLRPARRGAALVRVLEAGAPRLVHRARDARRTTCACASTTPTSCSHYSSGTGRRRVPASRSAGRSSRASPTAATSTSRSTPSTPARSSSTSTRRRRSATSRTSSSRPPAPTARRSRSSSTPTTRTRSAASSAPC